MKMPQPLLLTLLLSLAIFLTHAQLALAAPSGITISPSSQEVSLAEEPEKLVQIKITNHTTTHYVMSLSAKDFGSLDTGGGVAFLGERDPDEYRLASWLSLSPSLDLPAGQTVSIPVAITNESSLSPGGHYGAVVANLEPKDTPTNGQIAVHQSIASLLLVVKQGGATQKLDFVSSKFAQNWLGQVSDTSLELGSKGNTHVVPRGVIKFYDPFNRLVGTSIINTESASILPQSTRTILTKSQFSKIILWPGIYRAEIHYGFEGSEERQAVVKKIWGLGWVIPLLICGVVCGSAIWRISKRFIKAD